MLKAGFVETGSLFFKLWPKHVLWVELFFQTLEEKGILNLRRLAVIII